MDKKETINYLFEQIRSAGVARTQRDFAALLGINEKGFSAAMNGNEKYLTDSLVSKVTKFYEENVQPASASQSQTLPVIPTEAMAGTLGEFADSECDHCIKISDNRLISDKNKTKISIINGKQSAIYELTPCTQMPGIMPWEILGNGKVKE